MEARLLFIHALTPLHPGSGHGVGAIDLPVTREKATGLPYLAGSSLKGALRDAVVFDSEQLQLAAFGPETDQASLHAGAVFVADARLLLLPVRSVRGTFAWATSPLVLDRLARDAREASFDNVPPVPDLADEQSCQAGTAVADGNLVVLEEFDLRSSGPSPWADWLAERVFPEDERWRGHLVSRFCLVHDTVFSYLAQHATEVVARVRLKDDEKTVATGGLWYEEALPAETVLVSLVASTGSRRPGVQRTARELLTAVTQERTLTLGGKETVGRGRCRIVGAGVTT